MAAEAGWSGTELVDVRCVTKLCTDRINNRVVLKRSCKIIGKLATKFYGLSGDVGSYTLR